MGNLKFADAAFPLSSWPAADGFCFYIGGDTPHVWSMAEVATLKQHYRFLLPIYVRSDPPGPGAAADVDAAAARLKELKAPRGTLVAWDMETAADAAYIGQVYGGLAAAGFTLIVYGSQREVIGNKNPDGLYWGADWTDVPHLAGGDEMTQYVSFGGYDVSLATASLPFWDATGPVPVPPPPPATWTETVVKDLPTLGLYAGQHTPNADVRTVQGTLGARGYAVKIDGHFGTATLGAVKAFQRAKGLAVDGIVGPHTWTALLNR